MSDKPHQHPWKSRPRIGSSDSEQTYDDSPSTSPSRGRMYTLSYTHAPAHKKDPTLMWDKVYSHSNSPNRSRSSSTNDTHDLSCKAIPFNTSGPTVNQDSKPVPAKRPSQNVRSTINGHCIHDGNRGMKEKGVENQCEGQENNFSIVSPSWSSETNKVSVLMHEIWVGWWQVDATLHNKNFNNRHRSLA